MSEPEIDRRCTLCGAAVRSRAAFCPQCGQPTSPPSKAANTQIDLNEFPPIVNTNDTVPLLQEPPPDIYETRPLIAVPAALAPPSDAKVETQNIAPAVEGGAKGRVEKIRKVSSVVIDQAAYDPSLRFVLVAAAFFLLFLFLLLMSRVLG
jgi:hypothetical protein